MKSSWTGVLSIPSMGEGFEIPLRMAPASSEEKIGLRMICRDHGSTLEMVYQCNEGGEVVEADRQGRALVYGSDGHERVVVLEPEEILDCKEPISPHVITINSACSIHDFDAAAIVQAYRVWTDKAFEKLYASLFRAMDRTQTVGLGKMVINSKEGSNVYRAALRASGRKEFTVYRLRYLSEVREGVTITEEKADSTDVKVFTEALLALRNQPEEILVNTYNKKLSDLLRQKEEDYFKKVAQRSA